MVIIKHVLYHKSYINSVYSQTVTFLQTNVSDKKSIQGCFGTLQIQHRSMTLCCKVRIGWLARVSRMIVNKRSMISTKKHKAGFIFLAHN